MSTKAYKWRTQSTSYVYVDSNTGSDIYGNGTMQNPYQSLGKAWRGHTTYHPSYIVCRGYFSEDMSDGSHSTQIYGDYFGAATFDGQGKYTLFGFTLSCLHIRNCPSGTFDNTVLTNYPRLVGVGVAGNGHVGDANDVNGVAAPSVMIKQAGLYWGGIGGSTAVKFVGYVSPLCNDDAKLYFAVRNGTLYQNSVFDVPKEKRGTQNYYAANRVYEKWVFGKVAMFVNEGITFSNSLFTSDCEFYDGDTLLTPEGSTNEEKAAWLNAYAVANVKTANQRSVFKDCVFSAKTSYEVFNDPDNGDLTLNYLNCDSDLIPSFGTYRGAFPPALHIPLMENSEGVPATWDEQSASGLVSVVGSEAVVNDIDTQEGELRTKVIVLNPNEVSVSGLFMQYASLFATNGIKAGTEYPVGQDYALGDTLPEGRYLVHGGPVMEGDNYLNDGDVIVAGSAGCTPFLPIDGGDESAYFTEIPDGNIIDHLYLRSCPTAYHLVGQTDGLESGATYLNLYSKEITYRGRRIVPNESFVAVNDTDTFTCEDADYKIAAIFDDSRVPSQPWIPAQMWGEYFAGKLNGVYQTDSEGEYLGSGNYLAWMTKSNGGYYDQVAKSYAQARYVQLKLSVRKGGAS